MKFAEYLALLDGYIANDQQSEWYERLKEKIGDGLAIHKKASSSKKKLFHDEFNNRVRTEELKAWYSSPDGEMFFQGTSVSSLTIPCELSSPLLFNDVVDLENKIAENYISLHDKCAGTVKDAILENVDDWINSGLFYSITLSSKIISQAFGLMVSHKNVIFNVGGLSVDPHEITSYPRNIRKEYFKRVKEKITCFTGLDLQPEEMESSLILADISKPKIDLYKDNILLAPVRCNEIASVMARRVRELIISKTSGRIKPKSLAIVIFDTDSPYTYHHLMGGSSAIKVLPGLTILGSSGTIDAFRWLYLYRLSLISQKIMKSSLYSEAHKRFFPFIFFGVLVPRDAEILLELDNLSRLRYRGNIDPEMEFLYILPSICEYLNNPAGESIVNKLKSKVR